MRLHFQETPWDLYVVAGYVIVASATLLALNAGNPLALFVVLFVPGYVLVAFLFPGSLTRDRLEIDWIERIALSFGLSIAVVPLFGLLLNLTPWGIRFEAIVVTITLFTVSVGYAAYWRRRRLPLEQRLSLTIDFSVPNWKAYSALDKILTVTLSTCIIVACGTLVYLILTPRPGEVYTEFYLLGPSGRASGYPTDLNASQPESIILGIANHEATTVNYTVRVDLVGVKILYNATSGSNETVEVNRTTWSMFNVTLMDGRNWSQPYTFRINNTGLWAVQFLLFKEGDISSPYRQLHLYVRVA